jgi:CheY-like chemotaxis protein
VLVVEDDPGILNIVVQVLEDEGFEVESSYGDGRDALQKIEHRRPDVVLLDYQLPGMDGVQIAREIRGRGDLTDVKIVGMTAAGRMRRVCEEMQADGCLGKPFDLDDLIAVVAQEEHRGHRGIDG